ncbi:hypothetical protein BB560_004925, partial [Smittium megazygosporum]
TYIFTYGLRLLASFFAMEALLHIIHPNAILKERAFLELSALEISLICYFQLKFIWLKLLLIWRFARFFALLDGYSVIENMKRCMSNNYSLRSFWRDWHQSYNKFLVRYMYIPLLSAKVNKFVVIILVFLFVAIWHDLKLRLVAWAWLIVLLFLPELSAVYFSKKLKLGPHIKYFRFLVAFGGSFNIFSMILANLVGFALDVDGVLKMSEKSEERKKYSQFLAEKQAH